MHLQRPKFWSAVERVTAGLTKKHYLPVAVVSLLALATPSAQAAILGGTFATDGNGANAIVSLSNIQFSPTTNNLKVTSSTFTYNSGSLTVGTIGTIGTLSFPLPDLNFIGFNGTPLNFTLTGVGPGDTLDPHNCSNATSTGQSCSLLLPGNVVSPIVLTWSSGGTNVGLHIFGTVTDGTQTATWQGDLTTSLTGALQPPLVSSFFSSTSHPQDVFAYFNANPNGNITSSNQGTFSATMVPEPGTLSMGLGGLGMTLFGMWLRRRRS